MNFDNCQFTIVFDTLERAGGEQEGGGGGGEEGRKFIWKTFKRRSGRHWTERNDVY